MSSNGKLITAVEKNGFVFISLDYGVTWQIAPDPILSSQVWQAISVSSNGRYQSAVVYGGHIYTSNLRQ